MPSQNMNSTLGVMTATDHNLPWRRSLRGNRCKVRLNSSEDHGYHGRCELTREHDGAHALERGMEIVRFHDV